MSEHLNEPEKVHKSLYEKALYDAFIEGRFFVIEGKEYLKIIEEIYPDKGLRGNMFNNDD